MGKRPAPQSTEITCANRIQVPGSWPAINLASIHGQGGTEHYSELLKHNQASSAANPEDLRKCFTPEAFIDAIVDFIVSNDQVLVLCVPFWVIDLYILWSEY